MKIEKPSLILAYAGWFSLFAETWLLLLRIIPGDGLSITFFVMFFLLGLMGSAVYAGKPKKYLTDIRVRIGDRVYSEENGNLTVVQNGGVALCVIQPKDLEQK